MSMDGDQLEHNRPRERGTYLAWRHTAQRTLYSRDRSTAPEPPFRSVCRRSLPPPGTAEGDGTRTPG